MSDRLLTPSKITAWLDCAHYLTLRNLADLGELQPTTNAGIGSFARLLMDKGNLHEHAHLERLAERGGSVYRVPDKAKGESFAQWTNRVGDVLSAGHDVIYQLPMIHDGLRGVADFLIKVPVASDLGDFSYEPVDAKLARKEAKPGHVLKLCFYADALAAAQGVRPQRLHIHLGSGEDETIRLSDVDAYWRRIRGQLRALVDSDHDADTEPEPCTHCEFCEFADICDTHWREQDALDYVAGIRATDMANLRVAGVTTLTALADRTDEVATNIVLLGDPLQLAQVSQAHTHPGGAGASTLEHVLGPGVATMPANQGVFLDTTWRMHGDLCDFLSTHIYDGRLRSHVDCANQSVDGQTGLRWIRAEHNGCSTESAVEADLVVDTVRSGAASTSRPYGVAKESSSRR